MKEIKILAEKSFSIKCDICGKFRSSDDCELEWERSDFDNKYTVVGAKCNKCLTTNKDK